ncbi:hypothetical protein [Novosphingobium sp.]|uniref:hypothetical protein n=1 Tax=Novosphingobium sp. TaxID=1874826 RepID=UPI003B51B4A7
MPTEDHWKQFHERRNRLRLPQRPDQAVVDRFADLVCDHDARVLMLGLTPELATIGHDLTIADWNDEALHRPVPRASERTSLVRIDWREMVFPPHAFTAVIGDGGMTMVPSAADYRQIFARLADCMVPGAPVVVRCFVSPDDPEPLSAIRDAVMSGQEPSFHALKWRVAMAAAAPAGVIPVRAIAAAFDECFPDRTDLCAQTGWPPHLVAEIDNYRISDAVYTFFNRAALFATLPATFANPRLVASGDYPLSHCCPFLVAERATDA